MEVFTGLKPGALMARPAPMKKFANYIAIDKERTTDIARIDELHKRLETVEKKMSKDNKLVRKKRRACTRTKKVVSINFHMKYYVMIHPTRLWRRKLYVGWIGLMRIIDEKSDLVFLVEDLRKTRREAVHAQYILPHLAQRSLQRIFKELLEYTKYFDYSLQLIKNLHEFRMKNGEYKISVSWAGWNDVDDRTWKTFALLKFRHPCDGKRFPEFPQRKQHESEHFK